jgi:dolichol-phosphate mannosyltransferase
MVASMSALMIFCMLLSSSIIATTGFGLGAAVFFVGGLLLLCMGVLGEYLGRVYDEVRSRPLSIINRVYGSPSLVAAQVGAMAVKSDNYPNRNATEAA